MKIESIVAISALFISFTGSLYNFYKLRDEQKTWEDEQKISLDKKLLFKTLKKRRKLYGNLFNLLGKVKDINYPKEHYINLQYNKETLLKNADLILEELYNEVGLYMSYEARSIIIKVYQDTYRYIENKISVNNLIDTYYNGRRALRKDLEFNDFEPTISSKSILKMNNNNNENFKWKISNILAYSSRPGYPNKIVALSTLDKTIGLWKDKGIKSIICLLSDKEIKEYYESINFNLINFYKLNGFKVFHLSINDFKKPALNNIELNIILKEQKKLELPLLVHCGAGEDRTGIVVDYLAYNYNYNSQL